MPVISQRERVAQIVFNLLFQLRLRHHRIKGWLGIGAIFWPDAVTPINFFDRSLISYTLYNVSVLSETFVDASGRKKASSVPLKIEPAAAMQINRANKPCPENNLRCAVRFPFTDLFYPKRVKDVETFSRFCELRLRISN